jgi:HAD superfamily hydrolase (TIGR01450 family)
LADTSLNYDGLIIDLDGVVWRGREPIAGAAAAIMALRARGTRVVFLTNEPGRSRRELVAKLAEMGIPATEADVLTSAAATAQFVSSLDDLEGRRALVAGPPALHEEIRAAGFEVVSFEEATRACVVVVGGHEGFDYEELLAATAALRNGARLFATGRDAVFPTESGPRPGTGAVLAAIEIAGGAVAQVIGKPERIMFEIARQALGGADRVAMVGDNLVADIEGAMRAGLDAILVMSGTTSRAELQRSNVLPDLVLETLAALPNAKRPS